MRERLVPILRGAVVLAAVALAAMRFVVIDRGSHSASDTLRPWLIETALIALATIVVVAAVGRLGTASR